MRIILSLWILIPTLAVAADKCPDLSGHYMIQGEDGQVLIWITQTGCERITIDRKAGYLGKRTSEKHLLKLDGVFQNDTAWFGGSDKLKTSARFVSDGLEIIAKAASPEKSSKVFWKHLYELLPNKDLSIKEFDERTQSYQSSTVAQRIACRR